MGKSMGMKEKLKTYTSLGFYHKFSQLRADSWARLKEQLRRLAEKRLDEVDYRVARRSVHALMRLLESIEDYTAFPSKKDFEHLWELYNSRNFKQLSRVVHRIERALVTDSFRRKTIELGLDVKSWNLDEEQEAIDRQRVQKDSRQRPYFELLVVDAFGSRNEEESLREAFLEMRQPEDRYIYDVTTVSTFEDALIAIMINRNIQSCVIRYGFGLRSRNAYDIFNHFLLKLDEKEILTLSENERSILLGKKIKQIRPEVDLFLSTGERVEETASQETHHFRRIFYREPGYTEHHSSILGGIHERFKTPFFSALKEYARKPTGVFHAMPLSRGKSVQRSHWIQDFADFYGYNLFQAETSATSGGLDSLLQPRGPMKQAQKLAARAFGAKETYFVTNGTSTANKIVVQALVKPDDIVLVDRDCHKSHHYGMVLAGAKVSYLDSYQLSEYSIYGAVPLRTIKQKLLRLKRAGKLDQVKMLILTNCTFDGVVYNVQRVMEECLAIKPDLIFLWDEAWFGFAAFNPTYRTRTGMYSAANLKEKYASEEYRQQYKSYLEDIASLEDSEEALLDQHLLPDPDQVRIRVYATQSTHKTLTSLRQGSMIHIHDQDFRRMSKAAFDEAYMTHTSTSPNYQILASLDIGRRQVEMEGYELVNFQIEAAMTIREQITVSPVLSKYFRVLLNKDIVPEIYRPSGVESYYDAQKGWSRMEDAWENDEFVLDPCRVTLFIGETGIDGDAFKNDYLMDQFGIQINKTSRNTVLFMTHIGTNRSSVTFLLEVLSKIVRKLELMHEDFSHEEHLLHEKKVNSLTVEYPPLPDFSYFHKRFKDDGEIETPEGDIRSAYFLSYDEENCEYLRFDTGEIQQAMAEGREVVSATFVTPYPPGFPVLVPGQVVNKDILDFMLALDVKEIHGYRADLGLKVFKNHLVI